MKFSIRPVAFLLGLLAALAMLAIACGGDEEEGPAATNPPAGTGAAASHTGGGLKLGAAGIAKNPRTARGLAGWTGLTESLDDGLAIWKTRPAGENRTGVTKDTIKLGQSALITGPASDVEACWGPLNQAVLKRINEAGGIHGRKLEFIKYDDALNPALTVQNIKKLVEQDKIFAIFFSENTVGHNATRSYIMEQRLLEIGANDNDLGALEPPWPFYAGVSYAAPLVGPGVYADYIKQNTPNAKVGIITTDSAYSQNDRTIFKAQAEKQGLNIVADVLVPQAQVDPTSQVQQIVTAGADVIVNNLLPIPVPNALTALRQTIGNKTIKTFKFGTPRSNELSSLFDGDISVNSFKTPLTHPEMQVWKDLEKLASEENARWCGANSVSVLHNTEILVRALEAVGPDPTREGVLEGMQYAFSGYNCTNCITPMHLSYVDNQAFESFQFGRWSDAEKKVVPVGQPISYETSQGKGVRGNDPKYGCTIPSEIAALKLPNFPSTLCPWKN